MLDCWPTTGCEIISRKNYERLFRGWRRLFIGGLKERMHRNRQNGQLHALQREAGRLQRRSIEITVAVRYPSSIHLSVVEQKTVPGTVFSIYTAPRLCPDLMRKAGVVTLRAARFG